MHICGVIVFETELNPAQAVSYSIFYINYAVFHSVSNTMTSQICIIYITLSDTQFTFSFLIFK